MSGPARPARRTATPLPAQRRTGAQRGLLLGLASALGGIAQHRLFDRLIRGRAWIGIVAFALIGIVTLQLGLLKLNGGIGRALEHDALLQRTNAALSIENSELAAGTRVEARAAQLGMTFAPAGTLRFLSAEAHGGIAKAVAALGSAAHAAAQAREASAAATSEAQSSEAGEGESGSGEAGAGQSSASEASGEAQATPTSGSTEVEAGSEASSSASAAPEATAETSSAPASEAEPSGGISASTAGG